MWAVAVCSPKPSPAGREGSKKTPGCDQAWVMLSRATPIGLVAMMIS
jgi:hypothetical protein